MTSDSQSESGGVVSSTALLARIKELEAMISPLEDEAAKLRKQLLDSKSEIKTGDIITWRNGSRTARVLDIIPWVCGEPMWRVINIRKDGSEGSICKVYPYDKPQRANAPGERPPGEPRT